MAEVTQLKRYDAPRINWGKWFLIGVGMVVSAFILVVPMLYIFIQAFSKGLMPVLENLANPDMPEVAATLTARMLGFVAEADRTSGEIVRITPVLEAA